MTAADVISRARELLKDKKIPYRRANSDFYPLINDAMHDLEIRRPDKLLSSSGTLNTVTDVTGLSTAIVFGSGDIEALASYVTSRFYAQEDADGFNPQMAASHMQRYEQLAMAR